MIAPDPHGQNPKGYPPENYHSPKKILEPSCPTSPNQRRGDDAQFRATEKLTRASLARMHLVCTGRHLNDKPEKKDSPSLRR